MSGERLKILGFYFGQTPDAEEHVRSIERKMMARMWILRHLKRAGVPQEDLNSIFKTLLRPVIDYAAPVYSSLLTKGQSDRLERLQMWAYKIVYGFNVSYDTVQREAGVQLLKDRCQELFVRFAKKLSTNPRFSDWFVRDPCHEHYTRKRKSLKNPRPRTERLKKNPLYAMRRTINEEEN